MSAETSQPVLKAPAASESEERDDPMPIWLIVLLFLLMYGCAIYFDEMGGWFSPQVYAPYKNVVELSSYQVSGPPDPGKLGWDVYKRPTCISCHQANGQGAPGQYPSLVGSEFVNEPEPGRVIRIVLKGLTGPIVVKGQSFNGAMVAWDYPPPTGLTDEEIAHVLTFVRQNKEWGNNAPAVTPERVKAVREKLKGHLAPFTVDELMKISPAD